MPNTAMISSITWMCSCLPVTLSQNTISTYAQRLVPVERSQIPPIRVSRELFDHKGCGNEMSPADLSVI